MPGDTVRDNQPTTNTNYTSIDQSSATKRRYEWSSLVCTVNQFTVISVKPSQTLNGKTSIRKQRQKVNVGKYIFYVFIVNNIDFLLIYNIFCVIFISIVEFIRTFTL